MLELRDAEIAGLRMQTDELLRLREKVEELNGIIAPQGPALCARPQGARGHPDGAVRRAASRTG